MIVVRIVLIGGVLVGLLALLIAEARSNHRTFLAAKSLASACFLLIGLSSLPHGAPFGTWIVIGLALAAVGDVCLALESGFKPGLAAFLLAHLAYIAAFATQAPASSWAPALATPFVIGSGIVACWLWPHLGRLRPAVLLYIAVITIMAWSATSAVLDGPAPLLALIGAMLFYLSDLAVARERFVTSSFSNKLWGLPVYYAGQVLLALSIAA